MKRETIYGFIDGYMRCNLFLLPVALVTEQDLTLRALLAAALLFAIACREQRVEQLERNVADLLDLFERLRMTTTDQLAELERQHQSLQDTLAAGYLTDDSRREVYREMQDISERIAGLKGPEGMEEGV